MKLYILPIETYKEYIKNDFNLINKNFNCYQYMDEIFLFYKWEQNVVYFDTKNKGFSYDIYAYNLKEQFNPIFLSYFEEAKNLLSLYITSGVKLDVKIFTPDNTFIKDSLVYFTKKIGVSQVQIISLNNFQNIDQYFFRDMTGYIIPTDNHQSIYVMFFLEYLNYCMRQLYIKSDSLHDINLYTVLVSQLYHSENKKQNTSLKIFNSYDSKSYDMADRVIDPIYVEKLDRSYYPCKTWNNRVVSDVSNEATTIETEGSYFIDDNIKDTSIITRIEYCYLSINDLFFEFEKILPQSMIAFCNGEEYIQRYVEYNTSIENYPDFSDIIKVDLKNEILDFIEELDLRNDFEDVIILMEQKIDSIIKKMERDNKSKTRNIIGICPACGEYGVILANKCYCCLYCNNFVLWKNTMLNNPNLGRVLTKNEMGQLLKPQSTYTTTIRNDRISLVPRESKTVQGINKFWSVEVL